MLIKEIEMSHTGGIDLTKLAREGEIPFGFNNEIDGYSFFKNTQDGLQVYYLIDGDNIIAALAGNVVTIHSMDYFQTKGVYVSSSHRGAQLALKIYHAIKLINKYRLMSDTMQTRAGIKLWSAINKKYSAKVMDLRTGKTVSDKIHDAYTNANYVLVTETSPRPGIIIPPL